jgi:flagellar motor switch protein FliN/FliY
MDQDEINRLMAGGAKGEAAKVPDLSELAQPPARAVIPMGTGGSLDTLLDMSLPVAIEFGRTHMTVQEVLELGSGSVIQLDRMVGEPIDIFVSDRKLAEGEVVVIGEHFGVRITRIVAGTDQPVSQREMA